MATVRTRSSSPGSPTNGTSTPRRSRSRRLRRCARARPSSCRRTWEKTYYEWLENIQPWCVSRQLWWGHQIPAWYAPWGAVYVEETEEAAYAGGLADGVERGAAERGASARPDERPRAARRNVQARRRRARHLVLLGAVAVLDPRLAGRNAGVETVLSDRRARHRVRHHLFLGRPDDDDGPPLHARNPVPRRLHPRARARREGRENVEVERQRHRPDRAHRPFRRRCAALHPGGDGGAGARHQALGSRASRAIGISRPNSGTPRASPR